MLDAGHQNNTCGGSKIQDYHDKTVFSDYTGNVICQVFQKYCGKGGSLIADLLVGVSVAFGSKVPMFS